MKAEYLLLLVVLCPCIGAILNGLIFRLANIGMVASISSLAVLLAFIFSCLLFAGGQDLTLHLFNWLTIPSFAQTNLIIPFSFSLDHLSILFLLIITGIGSLIHIYSAEYMIHEKKPYRFFVYLNLFIASMLLLVLGSNMLVTFIGWEGVGLCSYLLIGYWYTEEQNSLAAIKAFIMNRIGDVGFLLAMFICYMQFHSINYSDIAQIIATTPHNLIVEHACLFSILGLCILIAVAGKSAQIPLYTWLLDAMAGPTPVSALIHAATMVTAGIYLMTRMSFILVQSALVMHSIAIIGALTAICSAVFAISQTDIKKVLAYSTCSQLGYMVLACGVGAFEYGVAHVISHAFFKACLFLGAGSVIHALHHEQNIEKMGALLKKMPITGASFIIATLAIIGFPGLSGFFTKDAILTAAWSGPFGHPLLWVIAFLTAGMTAFYMCRLTTLVFFSKARWQLTASKHKINIRENNYIISIPLIILAFFSIIAGLIALPQFLTAKVDFISKFLAPVLHQSKLVLIQHAVIENQRTEIILLCLSILIVLLGAIWAIIRYRNGPIASKVYPSYLDEFYNRLIVTNLRRCARLLYTVVHCKIIENIVNGSAKIILVSSTVASDLHTGITRNYLKVFFLSLLILGIFVFS